MDLKDIVIAKAMFGGSSEGGGGGSSDFSTAEVTINNADGNILAVPMVYDVEGMSALLISIVSSDISTTALLPLFKGMLVIDTDISGTVSTTGNIEYADGQFIITGDGTITIS